MSVATSTIDRNHSNRSPLEVVERLADAAGEIGAAATALREAVDEIPGDWSSVWLDRMRRALHRIGFRALPTWVAPNEVMAGLRPGHPALTRRANGEWTLLLDRRWGKVYRADFDSDQGEWVDIDELSEELAHQPNEPLPWLLCEPVVKTPHDSVSTTIPPFRRLRELVRPDTADLWSIVLFGVLVGGLTLATPVAVQQLVNSVALGGLIQPVVVLALLLFAGLAFAAVLSALQAYVAEVVQRRIFVRVVGDLAHRLPRVDISAFDQKHGPELVNRFFDVMTVQKTGASLLLDGVALVLQTAIGLLLLSFYHPLMLAFSVLLVAGIAVVGVVLGRGAVRTAVTESKSKYAVASWLEEMAREPTALRSIGAAEFAFDRADFLARDYLRARRNHYRIVFRQLAGALGLQVFASAGLLGLGGGLVIAGQLTLGQLVASELIVTAIVASFAKLGKHLESLYDLLAAVDKVGYLFDLPLERDDGCVQERGDSGATIAFRDVCFAMDGHSIFEGLSFDIVAGERVAVVGAAGSGKSMLLDLLAGFRQPDRGYVTIDEADIRELNLESYRDQIAYVGGTDILEGTIADNVRLGRSHISVAVVRQALRKVGLLDSVLRLPEGLETVLSPDGSPLSRSQALRLGLARAVAAQPKLLLIDGILESLDEEAFDLVMQVILDPKARWTVVADCPREALAEGFGRVLRLDGRPEPSDTRAHRGEQS